jgi:hypothetical protein
MLFKNKKPIVNFNLEHLKSNDVFLCSYPKSGVTFLSFLLAAARLHHGGHKIIPTFYNIDFLIQDVHKLSHIAPGVSWGDCLGTFYKCHDPFFNVPNVIYLLRNPVDTLKSYFTFRRKLGSKDSLHEFLEGPEGIPGWLQHLESWIVKNSNASQSICMIEYESLTTNPKAVLQSLGRQLGLIFSDETADFAVRVSSIEQMRLAEDTFSLLNPVYSKYNLDFVRREATRSVDEFSATICDLIVSKTRNTYVASRSHSN